MKPIRVRGTAALPAVLLSLVLAAEASAIFVFNAAQSSITITHDAEDGVAGATGVNERTLVIPGGSIPTGTAPGALLTFDVMDQVGGDGESPAQYGMGQFTTPNVASMTIFSGSFVRQDEVETDPTMQMQGNSTVQADFTFVWDSSGLTGPPLIRDFNVPLSATITGTGTAGLIAENITWQADLNGAAAGGVITVAPTFNGSVTFTGPGEGLTSTQTGLLSAPRVLLLNGSAPLALPSGAQLIMSGTLRFFSDGNSPAELGPMLGGPAYTDAVLADNPRRFYTMDETVPGAPVQDFGSDGVDGNVLNPMNLEQGAPAPSVLHGSAYRFFGPNSADINAPPVLNGGFDTNPFTLEAWVRLDDFLFDNDMGDGSEMDQKFLGPPGTGNGLGLNSQEIILFGQTDMRKSANVMLDEFMHIVGVSYGDGTAELFLNGESLGAMSYDPASQIHARIGDSLLGILDSVAIYDYALSPERILAHFDVGKDDPSLVPLIGFSADPTFALVPEPASAVLLLGAIGGLTLRRRRRAA